MHGPGDEYLVVTESAGSITTTAMLTAALQRYAFVAARAEGRDVLEVACGAGGGLPVLARAVGRLIAGDTAWTNVRAATRTIGDRAKVLRFSAEALPFADGTFDTVAMLQAIYYIARPERFVSESHRVLRPGGQLLIATVNPRWRDFQPSALSRTYPDSEELRALLESVGFVVEVFGALPADDAWSSRFASAMRSLSFQFRLPWPGPFRAAIRRALHGPPVSFPEDLTRVARGSADLLAVRAGQTDTRHSILYATATRSL